jgi:hypothetical protein
MSNASSHDDHWPWPEELDACIAAPASHHVLFENEVVRVLEVIIEPGTREPLHTHRAPSVMIVDEPARIRYYTADTLTYETPGAAALDEPRTSWLDPEPPHAVENIDGHRYHAYRIELHPQRKCGVFSGGVAASRQCGVAGSGGRRGPGFRIRLSTIRGVGGS